MDPSSYQTLCRQSSDLFKNQLVLPVGWVVLELAEVGATVTATEIRRELGGQAENNQIREALKRLEKVEALRELPHAGPPSPHVWVRHEHPAWAFVEAWVQQLLAARKPSKQMGDPGFEPGTSSLSETRSNQLS